MKLLNLGCGKRYRSDWDNIDFTTRSKFVIAHDLSKSIPAPSNTYDVVYHSHLLEHLSKNDAPKFLQECLRVLRPRGVLRIVVPDLEAIAREYLNALEQANNRVAQWDANYDWILLELLDQMVRIHPGGGMSEYLNRQNIPNEDFVIQRAGTEAQELIKAGAQKQRLNGSNTRIFNRGLEKLAKPIYRYVRYSTYRRECWLKAFLGREYETLQLGRFRQQGEVHQWMYDRYSLQRLLEQCGFTQIIQHTATTSYISDWSSFNLDTETDGSIYKPDSLFMEAIKPFE